MTPWAAISALVPPLALGVGFLYAASANPGFDPVRQPLSDLGALTAPTRWLWAGVLAVMGLGHVVTALGLRPADIAGRWALGAGGVLLILLAIRPNNVVGKFTLLHTLGSAFTFGLLALWPAISAHAGPRVPWPLRRSVGVVTSVIAFVLIEVTLWGLILNADTDGIRELLLYAWTSIWPLVVVAWTLTDPGYAYPNVAGPQPRRAPRA